MIDIIITIISVLVFIGILGLSSRITQDKRMMEYEREKYRNTPRFF